MWASPKFILLGDTQSRISRIYAWHLYVTIHVQNLRYLTETHVYLAFYDFSVDRVLRLLYEDTHGLTHYSHEANDSRSYSSTDVLYRVRCLRVFSLQAQVEYLVLLKHPLAILDRIHHRIAISKCYRVP